jgi:CheY-like chemotaxis protein
VQNAIKFTPVGGRVSVRTSSDGDGHFRVDVADTGIGIDPAFLPRMFDPFERGDAAARPEFGGLGLGLAIARELVEAHGGMIRADSAGRGRGARFTVELPAVDAPEAVEVEEPAEPMPRRVMKPAARVGAAAADADRSSPLRVLLVEDHADTARLLARLLRSSAYAVTVADSVAAALDELVDPAAFDVLVSDIGLPDGSGWELLRRLREDPAARPLPAIALSGFSAVDDLRQSREAGFADHLVKPINVRRLQEAVARATH